MIALSFTAHEFNEADYREFSVEKTVFYSVAGFTNPCLSGQFTG
jgi:hypothetical protein